MCSEHGQEMDTDLAVLCRLQQGWESTRQVAGPEHGCSWKETGVDPIPGLAAEGCIGRGRLGA